MPSVSVPLNQIPGTGPGSGPNQDALSPADQPAANGPDEATDDSTLLPAVVVSSMTCLRGSVAHETPKQQRDAQEHGRKTFSQNSTHRYPLNHSKIFRRMKTFIRNRYRKNVRHYVKQKRGHCEIANCGFRIGRTGSSNHLFIELMNRWTDESIFVDSLLRRFGCRVAAKKT